MTSTCLYLVAQSCLNLCDPMDCSPPGSSVHGGSLGKNTGVGCQALLQAILPTQGSNPCLLNCRQILYHFSHQGSISPLIYYQLNFSQQYFVVFSIQVSHIFYQMHFKVFHIFDMVNDIIFHFNS